VLEILLYKAIAMHIGESSKLFLTVLSLVAKANFSQDLEISGSAIFSPQKIKIETITFIILNQFIHSCRFIFGDLLFSCHS
jgi:hypothetical protein